MRALSNNSETFPNFKFRQLFKQYLAWARPIETKSPCTSGHRAWDKIQSKQLRMNMGQGGTSFRPTVFEENRVLELFPLAETEKPLSVGEKTGK
jgi:hypothetical protein